MYQFPKYKYLSVADIKVPGNPDVYLRIEDILTVVTRIHKDACKKYPAFGWEESPTEDRDASPSCNLNAILRHTLLAASDRYTDKDSGFPHLWHICCRLQMYITSLFRTHIRQDAIINSFKLSSKIPSLTHTCYRLPDMDVSMVTPEFVYLSILALTENSSIGVLAFPEILEKYLLVIKEEKIDPAQSLARYFMTEYLTILPTLPTFLSELEPNIHELRSCILLAREIFAYFCTTYSSYLSEWRQSQPWDSLPYGPAKDRLDSKTHSIDLECQASSGS